MMTSYIYPILSFMVFIASLFWYCKATVLSRISCSFLYLVVSCLWILNLGFCGADIPTYLRMFSAYTIYNPFFYSYSEFSVGIFTGLLKLFNPTDNAYLIATLYRFFVFGIIPFALILFSPSSRVSSVRLGSLLIFLALTPYTFLSATNIINNGLAYVFIYYYLLVALTRRLLSHSKSQPFTWLELFFLFFAAFAHPFGIGIIALSFFALTLFNLLRRLSMFTFSSKLASGQYPFLIIAPLAFFFTLAALPRLSSTLTDSTVLVSSTIMIISLLFFRKSLLSFVSHRISGLSGYLNDCGVYSWGLFSLFCLFSFFSVFIVLLGGGDAGERFVGSLISWLTLLSLLLLHARMFSNPLRMLKSEFSSRFVRPHSLSIHYEAFFLLILLGVQSLYFYSSNAFLHNSVSGPFCL